MLLAVFLVLLVLLRLLWQGPRGGAGDRWLRGGLSVAAVGIAATSALLPAPPPEAWPGPRVQPADGYLGSAGCRACHPAEHHSWHGSFHRTMTQPATAATLLPRFQALELDWFGKPVRLQWREDTLWAQFDRGGAAPAAVDRPVVQLTGSHHLQVLWYATGKGRELAPVPLCYHLEERRWLPLTAVFVLPPEFRDPPEPGAWSQSCGHCHATHTEPRFGAEGNDTAVAELGIACEACHGPGAAHAARFGDPLARLAARGAAGDKGIADPADLPPARAADVCGHCHAVSILREAHFAAWPERGSPFRPGQDLQATHLVIGPQERDAPELARELRKNPHFFRSSFWPDGEVRLSGREYNGLVRSPCFTHGQGDRQLDCTACHRMHHDGAPGFPAAAWRDDQLGPGMDGNAACTQCHPQFAAPAALAAHTRHDAASVGSSCYACHMPHTSTGLLKASRSHAITSPRVATELATGRPNACNLCHLDRTLQWTAEQLHAGFGQPVPELDAEQRSTAAGVRWLLTGDAGLRFLAAWHAGRPEAHAAAGRDWQWPFLARLLDDPYHAVRFAAHRSLRGLPGGAAALAGYDSLADGAALARAATAAAAAWNPPPGPPRPAVLLGGQDLDRQAFARLYARRDDRPVYLAE